MSLPDAMRAVEISEAGAPEVLRLTSRPVPMPGHDQIVIRLSYAGVNRPDVLQRSGAYPPPPGHSKLPGLEVSGHVAALGDGVTRWKAGDAVCALVNGGGYASYTIAEEPIALPSNCSEKWMKAMSAGLSSSSRRPAACS